MHKTLIIIPLLLGATPAAAQDTSEVAHLPRVLTDPAAQMRLVSKLQSISNALLDVKIGGVAAALQGREAGSREKDTTVGDLVRQKDPNFDRDVAREVVTVGPKVQRTMQQLSRTLPRVMRDVADAQKSIDRAFANVPDPSYPQR